MGLWTLPLVERVITCGLRAAATCPAVSLSCTPPLGLQQYYGCLRQPAACSPMLTALPLSAPRSHQPLCLVGGATSLGLSLSCSHWTLPWMGKQSRRGSGMPSPVSTFGSRHLPRPLVLQWCYERFSREISSVRVLHCLGAGDCSPSSATF